MPTSTWGAVVSASFLACLVTMIGIFVIKRCEKWGSANVAYFMSFAAGVLISVSFIHIIPKSFDMNKSAPSYLLVGFLSLHLTNRFLNTYICHEYDCASYSLGLIPMLGIGFHSFLDGVIYSVTFNVSVFTGILTALGMILHEFPEGIVTFLLLERGGFDRKKSTWYAILSAAVSTPLGTLVSYPFIHEITRPALGALLALSAGALVYVGASHLLPAVEREEKRFTLVALAIGVLVAVIIVMSKA
jgi:zinc transporter ZupT